MNRQLADFGELDRFLRNLHGENQAAQFRILDTAGFFRDEPKGCMSPTEPTALLLRAQHRVIRRTKSASHKTSVNLIGSQTGKRCKNCQTLYQSTMRRLLSSRSFFFRGDGGSWQDIASFAST